jgi:hypothetical protein
MYEIFLTIVERFHCNNFLSHLSRMFSPPFNQSLFIKFPHFNNAPNFISLNHRYRKAKIDCLSVVMCPLLAQLKTGFFSIFLLRLFTVLISKQGKP